MSDWQDREEKAKAEARTALREGKGKAAEIVEKLYAAAFELGVEQGAAYAGEQLRDEQALLAGEAGEYVAPKSAPRAGPAVTLDAFA